MNMDQHIEVDAPRTASWLHDTIAAMVDNEDEVFIETNISDVETIFKVNVADSDLGQVIGIKGHTARALRMLLHNRGRKEDCRYGLDIAGKSTRPAAEISPIAELAR